MIFFGHRLTCQVGHMIELSFVGFFSVFTPTRCLSFPVTLIRRSVVESCCAMLLRESIQLVTHKTVTTGAELVPSVQNTSKYRTLLSKAAWKTSFWIPVNLQ